MRWKKYNDEKPEVGKKVVIVCNDGCSSSPCLVSDDGILDGEDGNEHYASFLNGSIWAYLPDEYPISFMERHDDY